MYVILLYLPLKDIHAKMIKEIGVKNSNSQSIKPAERSVSVAKIFNVTGPCIPKKHYMADTRKHVAQIRDMIDDGAYFTMNRARQYGKTTTLAALDKALSDDYLVIWLDFQSLGSASYQTEHSFSFAFLQLFIRELRRHQAEKVPVLGEFMIKLQTVLDSNHTSFDLMKLFKLLQEMCECSPKPIVLMIDEVDSASNNQVFLDFLAQLRNSYLERTTKGVSAFQSVILAGVYDIKNLRRKLRPEDDHKTNSPWNIAADFDIDMSLSKAGIEEMLKEYETDRQIPMDTGEIATLLHDYTSGYPYLVSRLCKFMDEKLQGTWTKEGFLQAVRMLLAETNTLFDSLISKLTDYPELEQMLMELLFLGKPITYNPTNPVINLAVMFGFVKNADGKAIPANRIFDTLLYNHFLSLDEMKSSSSSITSQ